MKKKHILNLQIELNLKIKMLGNENEQKKIIKTYICDKGCVYARKLCVSTLRIKIR